MTAADQRLIDNVIKLNSTMNDISQTLADINDSLVKILGVLKTSK